MRDFYRRVAEIRGVRYRPPQSAQEKFEAVRDALRILWPRLRDPSDRAADRETYALENEYNDLFALVSFNLPDPERQWREDLGLDDD